VVEYSPCTVPGPTSRWYPSGRESISNDFRKLKEWCSKMYENLRKNVMTSRALSTLKPCDEDSLQQVRRFKPDVPQDYIEFLREIGAGEIGKGQYTLYSGLVEPREIYGEVPQEVAKIVLFGDDMQGFCAGFDTTNWKIVEIDPTNMRISPVADSFESFIRQRIKSGTDHGF